ncbi:uncharacterized protein LOC113214972 [Frankliniella occidentalis]|uniref:Uncharacterized protein LOC113214972 n=1 Tax=Frankliniella occidentalis TaxID=133901 RepID=A0A6J1TEY6_FRAOC|nr:uncharacterized protein LOC113214972 [Frankliniella occidentalis]
MAASDTNGRGGSVALGQCLLAAVLVACALALQQGVEAVPVYEFKHEESVTIAADNACYQNEEVEELCQMCAKKTKSNVVYPMCCQDEEEVRQWCDAYVNFPLRQRPE